jgi:hypothetical protein
MVAPGFRTTPIAAFSRSRDRRLFTRSRNPLRVFARETHRAGGPNMVVNWFNRASLLLNSLQQKLTAYRLP